jgi:hypothetical protein
MKSYHFNILKGFKVAWPWLLRRKIYEDFTSVVIYPFIFYGSKHMTKLTTSDLQGNMDAIMLKQQEEILQAEIIAMIGLSYLVGWFSLLLLLVYPLIILISGFRSFKKKVSILNKFLLPFLVAWFMQENPFFREAYANCNYPNYLKKRIIFAWLIYPKELSFS